MPQAKKLIEVALPLDAINAASAREKSIRHGHPSTLHLWWARRPLAAARAVIFTSLVDDPDDPDALPEFVVACKDLPGDGPNVRAKGDSPRMRLFDFIERLVTWEATTDDAIMAQARDLIRIATKGNPPPLLDPFAGGGSIPLEAQRLGLEAHASDLNPVAVMINKAMIEIPPRFADMPPVNPRDRKSLFATETQRKQRIKGKSESHPHWKGAAGLAADVRYYGEWMRERAFERIGHLYPKHKGETVIAWLWARTVISPNPAVNAPVPLVRSFVLSKKRGRECWAQPVIEGTAVRFEVTKGKPPPGEDGTVNRRGGKCIVSGEPMAFDYIRAEGKAGRMGAQLMAIVTEGKRGRSYYSPSAEHARIAEDAEPAWKPVGNVPEQALGFRVQLYGMDEYHKLFTARQLVALTTFSDLVHEARELATRDALEAGLADDDVPLREGGSGARAYGEAVSVYLAFAVDKGANIWSTITSWMSDRGAFRETFARQAIPMVWDYAEANPFSDSGGSFDLFLKRIVKTVEYLPGTHGAYAEQVDAQSIRELRKLLLSTDPPYYDNIGYADLSDFFYIWMRKSLREVHPNVFGTMLVPKSTELIASKHRHSNLEEAKEFFESGMLETFTNIRRFVLDHYPLTVYYAFKQQDAGFLKNGTSGDVASTGWETMLTSLIMAGFSILGTWPVRTEGSGRANAQGTNSLASSIILVCRPRPEGAPATSRRRFLDALRAELPGAIAEMKTGSIAPVDMAQATIGPGMAIYSRYRAVLEADGNPLTVRAALGLINAALDETLEEQDAQLDPETRFAVDWFAQYGYAKGDFGRADVLARGKNTSVESVELAGLVEAGAGKVRLIHWKEYDPGAYDPGQDKRPTVWE
ncbi:MAG: DUF1156 domain-containing protein, partial [Chloroflexota bacterium]|nr:DUF1156 domain-containing protein [Chloroflexota bacterium]